MQVNPATQTRTYAPYVSLVRNSSEVVMKVKAFINIHGRNRPAP